MFDQIFVEDAVVNHAQTKLLLQHFKAKEPIMISSIEDYFGKVKKPYLQKRTNLNIYIGKKRGQLVKPAPDAYGLSGEPHFYFMHAYNCIYECSYCYLQGYFNSPDLVFFVNHEEVCQEIKATLVKYPNAWFHAGEFSDSLALNHLTDEWALYFELFKLHPKAKLELRTKSANIKSLLNFAPSKNIFVSYSLSSAKAAKLFDLKTPNLNLRLAAMKQLADHGYQLAIHLDPLIYLPSFQPDHEDLIQQIFTILSPDQIHYISLGTVRFTKDVLRSVTTNYPESAIHHQPFSASFDGKLRYAKPLRYWMMGLVQDLLIKNKLPKDKIYWCME